METERPQEQEARIREYRQEIDAAIQAGDDATVTEYKERLRDELLDADFLGDHDRYAEEAVYWHRTRDLFDHKELADAFPYSDRQTRHRAQVGEQLIKDGTITTTEQDIAYHLLSTDDVLEYINGRDADMDADHIEDELHDLRARLPVNRIERRYPGLQDDSV